MNSIDRFEMCMQHQSPDRPPLDLGATNLTGMRPLCQQRLLDLLGFSGPPEPSNSGVDERILRWAGTDFRSVGRMIDLESPHRQQISDTCFVNGWGIRKEFIDGEWQITHYPLAGATRADLETFSWPSPHIDEKLLRQWESDARQLYQNKEYAVIAQHPVYGILELGCWMCGYEDFMLKLAADPDFIRTFFDKVLEIQTAISQSYYSALGPYIHLTTSGDDFGTQRGPLVSPAMFAEFIAPYFAERIKLTKEIGDCLFWHHSCGSIYKLLPQIIDCGVDILNPIQTSAMDMTPGQLKAGFGDKLVFWGAMDVQQFLRQSSPDEVEQEVGRLINILGADGGFVMAPAHEVQDDIPPENIVAWISTVRNI